MADPVDNLKRADEHIAALARARPKSDIAARVRAAELQRAHEIRDAAARKIVDENAAKRIVNGSTGHAKPVAVVATALSDGLTNELFKGLVPFLKEIIGDA